MLSYRKRPLIGELCLRMKAKMKIIPLKHLFWEKEYR
jgi:hypothetical protein